MAMEAGEEMGLPEDARKYMEAVERFRAGEISVEELSQLLTGDDDPVLRAFMFQLNLECRYARDAYRTVLQVLTPSRQGNEPVFFWIHAFLLHAGLVSKYLWPAEATPTERQKVQDKQARNEPVPPKLLTRVRADERGARLRQAIGLTLPRPAQLVVARNHLEHFDEYMDEWEAQASHRNIADLEIIDGGAIPFDQIEVQRALNRQTLELSMQGTVYSLRDFAEVILEVARAVDRWHAAHSPWAHAGVVFPPPVLPPSNS